MAGADSTAVVSDSKGSNPYNFDTGSDHDINQSIYLTEHSASQYNGFGCLSQNEALSLAGPELKSRVSNFQEMGESRISAKRKHSISEEHQRPRRSPVENQPTNHHTDVATGSEPRPTTELTTTVGTFKRLILTTLAPNLSVLRVGEPKPAPPNANSNSNHPSEQIAKLAEFIDAVQEFLLRVSPQLQEDYKTYEGRSALSSLTSSVNAIKVVSEKVRQLVTTVMDSIGRLPAQPVLPPTVAPTVQPTSVLHTAVVSAAHGVVSSVAVPHVVVAPVVVVPAVVVPAVVVPAVVPVSSPYVLGGFTISSSSPESSVHMRGNGVSCHCCHKKCEPVICWKLHKNLRNKYCMAKYCLNCLKVKFPGCEAFPSCPACRMICECAACNQVRRAR